MVALTTEALPREAFAHAPASWRPVDRTRWTVLVGDLLAALVAGVAVADELVGSLPVVLLGLPAVWVVCVAALHGYDHRLLRPWAEEVHRVVEAGLALTLVAVAVASWWELEALPTHLLTLLVVTVSGSLLPRAAVRGWRRLSDRRDDRPRQRVIVTGRSADVDRLAAELRLAPGLCLDIVVSEISRLQEAVARHRAAAVIAVPCTELDPPALRRLGWDLERTGTQLFVAPGLVDVVPARAAVASSGVVPLVHVRASQLTGARRILKDVAERTMALLGLLLLAPLLALTVLAIRLDSPGPALFRQVRVGRDGRPFTMLKLRTMTDDAEQLCVELAPLNEADDVLFKMREDPRVTRLGRILRRYSVDEVPQLVNVLRGEMSLVGPRPPLPAEVLLYEPDVRRRFAVKPGITGLWQVSGRSDLSWEEAVRMDLRYVDNWSLGLDLRIVVRTLRAVVRHTGAY